MRSNIGPWGLITALPWTYFLALGALTVSFFIALFRPGRFPHVVLGVHLLGALLLLYGVAGFVETEPRFPTAYLHVGFTDQILESGVTRPELDARFSWPGFFAAAAAVTGAAGLENPLSLVRWAPVVLTALYLPSIWVIGRQLGLSQTATWLALWMYLPVNWIGQDYFAPQTLGFILYLAAVAVVVAFFRTRDTDVHGLADAEHRRRDWWGLRRWTFDGDRDLAARPGFRLALVALLVVVAAAIAVSHQLTPVLLVVATAGLAVVGRLRLLTFPVVAGILTVGWVSLATGAYWVGHLDDILGGLTDLGSSVNRVETRVSGSDEHLAVVRVRVWFTAIVWGVMALSVLLITWRRKRPPVTLLVLALAPFVAAAQGYGGEGLLRVFLFSAPFACLLIASTFDFRPDHAVVRGLALVVALALPPLFILMRYGNEWFEYVRPAEMDAVRAIQVLAPDGSNLVSPTTPVPWRYDRAADYRFDRPEDELGFLDGDSDAIRYPVDEEEAAKAPTYLFVTDAQVIYATEALGYPQNWFTENVQPQLTAENGYTLVYRNDSALVYEYEVPK